MRQILTALLVALPVALIVSLAAVGSVMYWNRMQTQAQQEASQVLSAQAAAQVSALFSYDYQTVERSLTEAYSSLTPDYQREFQDQANGRIIPEARENKLVVQADIVGSGVMEVSRNTGSVLVFMSRTISDKSDKTVYDGSRVRVDYQKIDGKWLISAIAPI